MNYFAVITPKLISFFLLILLGFTISRLGIIPQSSLPSLSALLIKVVLPCLTVSLLSQRGTAFRDLLDFYPIVTWQIGSYFVLALAGLVSVRLARIRPVTSNVHIGCMIGGNYGFVVIPILMALYSPDNGQQYIPVCSAVDTAMVWTLGLAFFTHGIGTGEIPWYRLLLKRLCNPILISIAAVLLLNSLRIPIPRTLLDVCTNVGNISYSLGLIYVGCTICFLKAGSLRGLKTIWLLIVEKLFLVPFFIYLVSSHFLSHTESIVLMLIAGAPSMTTSCMIANQYGLDEDYASAAVFATTLSCLITIPLLFLAVSLVG